jgi:chromosome segregation ATPase
MAQPTLPGLDVISALRGLQRELSTAAAQLDTSAALLQTRLNNQMQRLNQLAEQASADAKRRFERMEAIVRGGLENFESELEDLESGLDVGPEVDALENGLRALYAQLEDVIDRKSDIGKQLAIVEQKLNEELLRLHEYIRSTVAAATPL